MEALEAVAGVDLLDVDEHGLGEQAAQAEVDGAAAPVAPDLGHAARAGAAREARQRDGVAVAEGVAEIEATGSARNGDELLKCEVGAQEPVEAAEIGRGESQVG